MAEPKEGAEAGSGQLQTGWAAVSVLGTDKAFAGTSPWTSPAGLSPATHGGWELCGDWQHSLESP